jgi:cytochrome oxidase Cu insertion factor (SCO1/SenC/PrrC family)
MKRILIISLLIIGLSICILSCQKAHQYDSNSISTGSVNSSNSGKESVGSQPPVAPQTQLKVGDTAPDFTLTDTEGHEVKLSDFRGKKNVVLAFYVLAFTGG